MTESKYSILSWNGKEGIESVFIVKDNKTQKQALFTPGRLSDIVWVREDLTSTYSDWKDFEEEPADNLEDVVF